jgi:TPR repeat protein
MHKTGSVLCIYDGNGVPKDYVQAHKWFNLAAPKYEASEALRPETAIQNRDRVAAKMTPAQIAEAQRLAREWRPQ